MTRPKKTSSATTQKRTARPSAARPAPPRPPRTRSVAATKAPAEARAKAPPPAAKPPAEKLAEKRRPPARESVAASPAVVAQIRELEAQLDRLIDQASRHDLSALVPEEEDDEDTEDDAQRAAEDAAFDAEDVSIAVADQAVSADEEEPSSSPTSAGFPAPRPSSAFGAGPLPEHRTSSNVPPPPESVFDTARELLSSDFYLRKWGKLAMRGRSEEVDDFGFDPIYDAKLKPVLDFLYGTYFRVETVGIENVPAAGRCLLVANHSGTLPLDGVMIKAAVKRGHSAPRDVRWLTEDFIYHFPYLGSAMNRLGAVRACQENAERLLDKEQLVAVFPEGVKGIGKLFAERYRLQRFGRGGFIKLCLRTGTPIVPVAVVGAEETSPLLFKIEHLSKALGVPYIPVTPTFPILGPLGLLPAPTKWRILFGEPLDLSPYGPEAADDEILVGKLAERVRAAIQGMLDRAVGARKSVFFG